MVALASMIFTLLGPRLAAIGMLIGALLGAAMALPFSWHATKPIMRLQKTTAA